VVSETVLGEKWQGKEKKKNLIAKLDATTRLKKMAEMVVGRATYEKRTKSAEVKKKTTLKFS